MKPVRPWTVVFAAMAGMAVSGNPIGFATTSLFMKPMTEEFGWTRSDYAIGAFVAALPAAVCAPLVGKAADRWGVRPVLLTGVVLFAASIAALSLVNGSLAQYGMLTLFSALATLMQGPILYSKAVAQAVDRRRGLALAVAMNGSALGAMLIPLLTSVLLQAYGWRGARIGLGLTVLVVALPAVFFFIRPPPPVAPAPDTPAPEEDGLTLGAAARTRPFWLLLAMFALTGASLHGAFGHMGALIEDRGLGVTLAASALSLAGLAQMAARFGSGWFLDRFASPQVGHLWFLFGAAGLAMLSAAATPGAMVASVLLIGLGLGAELELLAFYVSRFFGLRAFGLVYGMIFGAFMLGIAIGPLATARLYDVNGDYRLAMLIMAGATVLASAALLGVGPYRFAPGRRL